MAHVRGSVDQRRGAFAPLDVALLVGLGVVWGAAYVFIRQGLVLGASPLAFASVRYALAAAIFGLIAACRRERLPSRRAFAISLSAGGLLFIGLYGGLLFWGEQFTTGGYASVLASIAPILTVAVAYLLLPEERLSVASLLGIGLGFVGVVVLALPQLLSAGGAGWQGPLAILGAFVSAAFGTVLLRKYGGGPQGLWQLGGQFATGAALLGLAAIVLPFPESLPLTLGVWSAIAALVVFSSVIGYFIYFVLHHRVGPVHANLVAYLLPVVGIGIGTGFFAEPVTSWEIAGFAIVVLGVTLVLFVRPHRPAASAPSEGATPGHL